MTEIKPHDFPNSITQTMYPIVEIAYETRARASADGPWAPPVADRSARYAGEDLDAPVTRMAMIIAMNTAYDDSCEAAMLIKPDQRDIFLERFQNCSSRVCNCRKAASEIMNMIVADYQAPAKRHDLER
jgi:hypothetical protein